MTSTHCQLMTIQIAWRYRPRASYCRFAEIWLQRPRVNRPAPSRESIPTGRPRHTECISRVESTSRQDPKRARNIQNP